MQCTQKIYIKKKRDMLKIISKNKNMAAEIFAIVKIISSLNLKQEVY